ncbi:hypothetical protein BO83DRAFT_405637 [Aspergillus eucalypticola CBS 122712]|uniref:Protein kinase domain-containing protein n=1 Tax=Aspergillus eucalypticola (strain CBS 122712 / IBT 29274) TaxID=1448314 RepID=A0A317W5U3_ASPEC|nr:uncharacterized protein BO83DRAFT_405637 [Aspergillus eucalypticola CBS 122712]PWY81001.1 hypothetical protein BO83DRAFT_405637 [Aspergillus eucalypticola CBS 122712]
MVTTYSPGTHSSEQDLESYERFALEDHVRDIISELCKIPAAREEFGLGDGVERSGSDTKMSRPDQFCIHRVDGHINTLLITIEYKVSHKLPEIVEPDIVPTDGPEKQRYNAARLAGSVAVQQFHGMIEYGVGCSSITNGLIDVQLWVPFDDPATLHYDVGGPDTNAQGPHTRVERALCACLMSFRTPFRDQAWRNAAANKLPKWHTSFDSERSQIPATELPQNPKLDYACSEYTSPEQSTSEYIPSSVWGAPSSDQHIQGDSSDSEVDPVASAGRKRGFSQVTSSPPAQRSAPQAGPRANQSGQSRPHAAQYCTRGDYGVLFKITCTTFGYTVLGKGTTHGAGRIRHMLLMGWGGESLNNIILDKTIPAGISQSVKEIRSLGICHQDLRLENVLWNAELQRALIINFHRCTLAHWPVYNRQGDFKRLGCGPEGRKSKSLRVV